MYYLERLSIMPIPMLVIGIIIILGPPIYWAYLAYKEAFKLAKEDDS